LTTSKVIAKAKTPSVNDSSRPRGMKPVAFTDFAKRAPCAADAKVAKA
jgi:hypothetical protein